MKNKGFTLIELLAVIAILAIIAIIAVPIVLNVIGDAEHELYQRSIENYMRAVELAVASKSIDDPSRDLDGKYKIEGNKIILQHCKFDCEIKVDVDENVITTGTIIVEQEKVKQLKYLNKKLKKYVNATEEEMFIVEDFSESTLVNGENFNKKIREMVNNDSSIVDEKVISIEFLSFGQLPNEYSTIEELKKLPSVDLSAKENKGKPTVAYYDSTTGKIYVYSEDLIVFSSSLSMMFMNFKVLSNVNFGDVDTSNVKGMNWMFGTHSGNQITKLDLSMFDTSKVTSMNHMFYGCNNLKSVDLSSFNTSNVTNIVYMFQSAAVEQLDLSSFNISKVKSTEGLFYGCVKLKSVDLSSFDTSNVTNMSQMFWACQNLIELDLTSFDTSSLTNISIMFGSNTNLKSILVSDTWDLNREGITGVDNMFNGCGISEVTYK